MEYYDEDNCPFFGQIFTVRQEVPTEVLAKVTRVGHLDDGVCIEVRLKSVFIF